jgi:hypothetical protein
MTELLPTDPDIVRRAAVSVVRAARPLGGRQIEPDRLAKLLTYAAVFALWSTRAEFDGGAPWPPWWPAQTAMLQRVLNALEHPSVRG